MNATVTKTEKATARTSKAMEEAIDLVGFDYDVEEELLRRVREILPIFQRNAEQSEIDRTIPQESVDALDAAELLAVTLPRHLGGHGASWTTFCKIGIEISRVCPSTSWVYGLLGTSGYFVGLLPPALREEILKDGVPRLVGAVTPGGTVEKVEGGYIVNGRWPFATGCYYMKWASGACALKKPDGTLIPGCTAFMRADEVVVEDTWYIAGMKGTGSSTVVANNVFIPDHRLLLPAGESMRPVDQPKGIAPSEWYPFIALLVTTNSTVSIGAAQAMLAKVLADADKRGVHYSIYDKISESPVAQAKIAEASLKLRSAEQILWRSTNALDERAMERVEMPLEERALIRGEQAYINGLVREAADALLTVYGTSAFLAPSLMERHWRDINVITRHSIVHTNSGLETYGRALLGQPQNIIPGFL